MLKDQLVKLRNKLFGVNAIVAEIEELKLELELSATNGLIIEDEKEEVALSKKRQKPESFLLDDVISSLLVETRIRYLPLMWHEANYNQGLIDLSFVVFNPYRIFNPKHSVITVNGKNQVFEYEIIDDLDIVNISFSIKEVQEESYFAQVAFSYYPNLEIDHWRQSWYVPLFTHKLKLPDSKRLLRVIGDTRSSSYIVGGGDQAKKISLLLEKDLGLSLNTLKILDWGCGCGRISQFLTHIGVADLVGIDIDSDNVQWCQENIEGATFISSPYNPPTDFTDNSFDVIIGLSVMTHLKEETHKAWLQELNRILRPGGFALLSVRGLVYYHLTTDIKVLNQLIPRVEQEGFVDMICDPALNEVIDDPEYYRSTFYSSRYIRQVWNQYFNVVGIWEGLVLQDMIVLQKPNAQA